MVLRCVADANPPAKIVWKRAGRSDIVSLEETLQFRPVGRRDTGTYTCQAQNTVGASEPLSVQIDVKCKYYTINYICAIIWILQYRVEQKSTLESTC